LSVVIQDAKEALQMRASLKATGLFCGKSPI